SVNQTYPKGLALPLHLLSHVRYERKITIDNYCKQKGWALNSQNKSIGFAFSCLYAAMLVKTNRIARIFSQASLSAQRPLFISPLSQVEFLIDGQEPHTFFSFGHKPIKKELQLRI
ncbi:hypothetical protein ANCDUO_26267, partial [Ancylostoma duodenale]